MSKSPPPDSPTSAVPHNRCWRNNGSQLPRLARRHQGAFNSPERTLRVPYERQNDYDLGDEIEIDGKKWAVMGVRFEPGNDQAVVMAIEAGSLDRYNRGEIL